MSCSFSCKFSFSIRFSLRLSTFFGLMFKDSAIILRPRPLANILKTSFSLTVSWLYLARRLRKVISSKVIKTRNSLSAPGLNYGTALIFSQIKRSVFGDKTPITTLCIAFLMRRATADGCVSSGKSVPSSWITLR